MKITVPEFHKAVVDGFAQREAQAKEVNDQLKAANAELLEALKKISAIELQMYGPDWAEIQSAQDVANEAIKKHGGQS